MLLLIVIYAVVVSVVAVAGNESVDTVRSIINPVTRESMLLLLLALGVVVVLQ